MRRFVGTALVALFLAGCVQMPGSGPSSGEIAAARQTEAMPEGLMLFDIDMVVTNVLESFRTTPLSGRFGDGRPSPVQTIGVGDSLSVTIFEASAGGLFSTSNGQIGGGTKNVSLPVQEIGAAGSISVPYAGRIAVVGKTTDQVEKDIVDRLRDKAIEPQAMVALQAHRSNNVTIDGDVGRPGRLPISARGDRLIDAIASAGGIKGDPDDLVVRVTRRGASAVVPYRTILEDPAQNIWVWPGDLIFINREPQLFTAFGATGRAGNYPVRFDRTTLAEAIGSASGLNDDRAEPAGVFVYRRERGEIVCSLRGERPCARNGAIQPVVYRLNLRSPEGIALAQRIPVRNKDVLYVANADAAELLKFFRLLNAAGDFANSGTTAAARLKAM